MTTQALKSKTSILLFIACMAGLFFGFIMSLGSFVETMINFLLMLMGWMGFFSFFFLSFLLLTVYLPKRYKTILACTTALAFTFSLLDLSKQAWPQLDLKNDLFGVIEDNDEAASAGVEDYVKIKFISDKSFAKQSAILGATPIKNRRSRVTGELGNKNIFDVNYTIDSSGLRVSPPFIPKNDSSSFVFFGGSYAFGFGLNDNETIPYQVGLKTSGMYKIYNFAVNGYGAHHMAAALEHNLIDSVVKIKPRHIIFLGTYDQVRKSVNENNDGKHDPKYVLDEYGDAYYVGQFEDNKQNTMQEWGETIMKIFKASYIYSLLKPKNSDDLLNLYVALIKKSRDMVLQKYPDAKFHFIFYDYANESFVKKLRGLMAGANVDFHALHDINPEFINDKDKYGVKESIHRLPNTLVSESISDYIINKILYEKPATSLRIAISEDKAIKMLN